MKIFALCLRLAAALTICLPAFAQTSKTHFDVLVFSKTTGYRHASITNGIAAIQKLGAENNFGVFATEDSNYFTPSNLAKYKVVVFLSTSGHILNPEQQAALQRFVESGNGLVGVHAAIAGDVATEGSWPWYVELCCTTFTNHSAIVPATVNVEDLRNRSTAHLPPHWSRSDEWYNFTANPRGKVHVLAAVDETTYKGGNMGKDHPVAWCRKIGKGRMWYTALGHTEASFTDPLFVKHLLGGIEVAAGLKPANFSANAKPKVSAP